MQIGYKMYKIHTYCEKKQFDLNMVDSIFKEAQLQWILRMDMDPMYLWIQCSTYWLPMIFIATFMSWTPTTTLKAQSLLQGLGTSFPIKA